MEISIRSMREHDLDWILEIESCSFPTPWSRSSFVNEIYFNEFAAYLVCCFDDKVVGYGGMWLIFDEAHITNLAVHPDFRGKGIGMKLLASLIELGINNGAVRFTLEVRRSNATAQSLYGKMGFKTTGVRKGYYSDNKEDALIMWKIID
ncbi:MAG: ribosomal protein S18-alanine N-acetyltransferase [Syntrophomonadaceae bacterium]|nr:ribosomal protein S18-alanine N-acetyltransferase [Syntrophomonadaceae bacterium]